MYVGVGLAIAGQCLAFRSLALVAWLALFTVAVTVFVVAYEQPTLRARYGASYDPTAALFPRSCRAGPAIQANLAGAPSGWGPRRERSTPARSSRWLPHRDGRPEPGHHAGGADRWSTHHLRRGDRLGRDEPAVHARDHDRHGRAGRRDTGPDDRQRHRAQPDRQPRSAVTSTLIYAILE